MVSVGLILMICQKRTFMILLTLKQNSRRKNVLLKKKNQIPLVLWKIFLNKMDYYNIYKGDRALKCALSPFIFFALFYIHKISILTYTYCTLNSACVQFSMHRRSELHAK